MVRFSPNSSPKTLVIHDVKMLWKFEGFYPQQYNILQVPLLWNSGIRNVRKNHIL